MCMSNGLKQWVDVALTNIAINYLIDCLIYFSLSLFLSCVYIIHEVVLMYFDISSRKKHAFRSTKWKLFKDSNNVLF